MKSSRREKEIKIDNTRVINNIYYFKIGNSRVVNMVKIDNICK